jgi:glycosyltransferase involved in cell wall biosynthesis
LGHARFGHGSKALMEILFVSRCLPYPRHFGDRLILYHLLAGLRARGHTCDVVALMDEPDDREALSVSRTLCRSLTGVSKQPRSRLQYLARLLRPFPASPAAGWHPEMWKEIARHREARRYDLAHVFGGVQVYEFLALLRDLPTIAEPYESYSLWLQRAGADAESAVERMNNRLMLLAARRYESFMFRDYSRVVVVSHADRRTFESLSHDVRPIVIPNGVDRIDARRPDRSMELLFLGNFGYVPNQRAATILAREVLPRVRRDVPEARLVLAGADPPPAIKELAGEFVHVTGWVPDVTACLASAACFVAPMTRGAGIKNKVLEAMAAGVPVVTTPMGNDGIEATDGVEILLASTNADIVRQTVRVLRDPALAGSVGAAGQSLVRRRHAWPDIVARYEALYAEIVNERARRSSSSSPHIDRPNKS